MMLLLLIDKSIIYENYAESIKSQNQWLDQSKDILTGFRRSYFIKPIAIMVTINSQGGSLCQAKTIADYLKIYSSKNNTPIYCFAQDQCLNSANIILTTGSKCYANSMSLIGDLGYSWNRLWYNNFSKKYDIKQEYITAGQNKVKFDRFKQIKPQSQKWMQNYLYLLEHQLKVLVINNRSNKFQKSNLDIKDIQQKLFKKGIINIQSAIQYGYIDQIKNYDDIIKEKLSGEKIYQINPKQKGLGLKSLLENMGA